LKDRTDANHFAHVQSLKNLIKWCVKYRSV